MIYVSCTNFIAPEGFDQVWGIVRSPKKLPAGFKWVKELSPSPELFNEFLYLRSNGEWNEDSFKEIYVPQFLKEMHKKDAVQKLNELYFLDKKGTKIAICCFCIGEQMCHRSIVAGLLQGAGCDVQGVQRDYSEYYKKYKEREEKK